jgi:hypothetical protein
MRSRLIELGFEIFPRERQTPAALGGLVKADAEKWSRSSRRPGSSRIALNWSREAKKVVALTLATRRLTE